MLESEARFRTLFENAAVAIMVHDSETGAILEANRRAIQAYGYASLEELQHNDFWLGTPYSQAEALALIHRAAAGEPQRFEWKNADRYGKVFWEDVLLNRMVLNGVGRVLSITIDITERIQTRDALRESENRLKGFFDNVDSIMWIKDRDGRFLLANHYLANLLGRSREDILGRSVVDLFSLSEADAYADNDRLVLSTGKPRTFEETAVLQGRLHYFMSVKFPLQEADGSVYGIGAICTDITDMKHTETELKERNDELERFNRATVGRELDMLEMKKTINALSRELAREEPYPLAFLKDGDGEARP